MYRGGDLYFATNFVEAFVIGALPLLLGEEKTARFPSN